MSPQPQDVKTARQLRRAPFTSKKIFAVVLLAAAAGASTAASPQKPELTTLAQFPVGQSCTAPSGLNWLTQQTNGSFEPRFVDEGAGFGRYDYYHNGSDRKLTLNVGCTPQGLVWNIALTMEFQADGARRQVVIEQAYSRFGQPALILDLYADKDLLAEKRKNGHFGSELTAYWSTVPAPWKGTRNSLSSKECEGTAQDLRNLCVLSKSLKEEQARALELRGVVTKARFVFEPRDGAQVVKRQSIEMIDVAVLGRKNQDADAQQRARQQERDKRAEQRMPKY